MNTSRTACARRVAKGSFALRSERRGTAGKRSPRDPYGPGKRWGFPKSGLRPRAPGLTRRLANVWAFVRAVLPQVGGFDTGVG